MRCHQKQKMETVTRSPPGSAAQDTKTPWIERRGMIDILGVNQSADIYPGLNPSSKSLMGCTESTKLIITKFMRSRNPKLDFHPAGGQCYYYFPICPLQQIDSLSGRDSGKGQIYIGFMWEVNVMI